MTCRTGTQEGSGQVVVELPVGTKEDGTLEERKVREVERDRGGSKVSCREGWPASLRLREMGNVSVRETEEEGQKGKQLVHNPDLLSEGNGAEKLWLESSRSPGREFCSCLVLSCSMF